LTALTYNSDVFSRLVAAGGDVKNINGFPERETIAAELALLLSSAAALCALQNPVAQQALIGAHNHLFFGG
jgi:hypothetical protein